MYASLKKKLIGEPMIVEEQAKKEKKASKKDESDERHGGSWIYVSSIECQNS